MNTMLSSFVVALLLLAAEPVLAEPKRGHDRIQQASADDDAEYLIARGDPTRIYSSEWKNERDRRLRAQEVRAAEAEAKVRSLLHMPTCCCCRVVIVSAAASVQLPRGRSKPPRHESLAGKRC